jgi:hypothetical protein
MAYPNKVEAVLEVNSVEVQSSLEGGSLVQTSELTSKTDTMTFTLLNTSELGLEEFQEVALIDDTVTVFGGVITKLVDEKYGDDLLTKVTCSSYEYLATKILVKEEFEDKTDAQILASLASEYWSDLNATTYVTAIKTHDRLRLNRVYLSDVIKMLASDAGADWYIDPDKKLHFFLNEEQVAPYTLSDDPDLVNSFPLSNLVITSDGKGVINRVEVVGGFYRSPDTEFILPGTGEDTRVIMPFKMHKPDGQSGIQVWRNDGTEGTPVWTALTVLAGYVNELTGANQVLHYGEEKVLELQSAWPQLPNAVKVNAQYDIPLLARVTDEQSKIDYGQSIYFDGKIIDNTITTVAEAKLKADAMIRQSKDAIETLTFGVLEPGLVSGQTVTIVNANHGINSTYLIRRVRCVLDSSNYASYTVTAGAYSPDLIDFLIGLAKFADGLPEWREDEVLNEYLATLETLLLSEVVSSSTGAPPYVWGGLGAEATFERVNGEIQKVINVNPTGFASFPSAAFDGVEAIIYEGGETTPFGFDSVVDTGTNLSVVVSSHHLMQYMLNADYSDAVAAYGVLNHTTPTQHCLSFILDVNDLSLGTGKKTRIAADAGANWYIELLEAGAGQFLLTVYKDAVGSILLQTTLAAGTQYRITVFAKSASAPLALDGVVFASIETINGASGAESLQASELVTNADNSGALGNIEVGKISTDAVASSGSILIDWIFHSEAQGMIMPKFGAAYGSELGAGLCYAGADLYGELDYAKAGSSINIHFWVELASIRLQSGYTFDLCWALDGANEALLLEVDRTSSQYRFRLGVQLDSTSYSYTSWVGIDDATSQAEILIEFQASSAPGADDGTAGLTVATETKQELTGLDNDTFSSIDDVRFGVKSPSAGIRGFVGVDGIELIVPGENTMVWNMFSWS